MAFHLFHHIEGSRTDLALPLVLKTSTVKKMVINYAHCHDYLCIYGEIGSFIMHLHIHYFKYPPRAFYITEN
jgi:hypothetical protein